VALGGFEPHIPDQLYNMCTSYYDLLQRHIGCNQ